MTIDNEATLERALEACTHGRTDRLEELFTSDVTAWSPVLMAQGIAELRDAMADVDTALSDVEVQVDAIDAFGNKAVAEYRLTGRFTGPFEVEGVTAAPSGRLVVLGAAIVAEFEGRRIKAFRNYFDEMALLEQMLEPA